MTRTIQIGLLWHSDSSGNLGVGALTVGNMALVREAAARTGCDVAFHIFKMADPGHSYVHEGIATRHKITGRYMVSPNGYWRDLKKLDLMLDIGAGDSFADIYPDKRFAYMIATKRLCRWRGVPLVLSPQTIGPFRRQPHTALARRELEGAAAVFARDPLSVAVTREIAPKTRLFQASDVALAMPFEQAPKGPGVRFGLGVSGLLYFNSKAGRNPFGMQMDYCTFLDQLIEALLARGGMTVELIKHVLPTDAPHEDDSAATAELVARYPQLVDGPDFTGPVAAKSYISGLDFLISGRMHATIAAFSTGVPVVPMSYSRKFEGLYGGLDYPWLLPVKGMTTDEAVAYVLKAFDDRAALAVDIQRGMAIARTALDNYVETLAGLLTKIGSRR